MSNRSRSLTSLRHRQFSRLDVKVRMNFLVEKIIGYFRVLKMRNQKRFMFESSNTNQYCASEWNKIPSKCSLVLFFQYHGDILRVFCCKIFIKKFLKLEWTQESRTTALGFITHFILSFRDKLNSSVNILGINF